MRGNLKRITTTVLTTGSIPRACGGTYPNTSLKRHCVGLSPRVRGNRAFRRLRLFRSRSIPARAGEPAQQPQRDQAVLLYPRACGGTGRQTLYPGNAVGLSPRVRGNLHQLEDYRLDTRSIPARAGEPPVTVSLSACERVYPRACGGTKYIHHAANAINGLSPRVRGNLMLYAPILARVRSIPARAGEPARRRRLSHWSRVYPRACGGTRARCSGLCDP